MPTLIKEPVVKILADSINSEGYRLTTFELEYPRFIHAELMTHREFSRCAQSSRATPIELNIKKVTETPQAPVKWTLNGKGMVAVSDLPTALVPLAELAWTQAANTAAMMAGALNKLGLHKQIVNRILEPFLPIKVVVSSTQWSNFFNLRCAPDADPTMQLLACKMKQAYAESTPERIITLTMTDVDPVYGWHLPYFDKIQDVKQVVEYLKNHPEEDAILLPAKISAARCARVSYKSYDGSSSIEQDLKLFMRLLNNQHYSPMEHCATPFVTRYDKQSINNYIGWTQLRNLVGKPRPHERWINGHLAINNPFTHE